MKLFIKMLVSVSALVLLVSLSGCQTTYVNQSAYSAGGSRGGSAVAMPSTQASATVFGNQPAYPTPAALTNLTTWGATMSTPYWWNDTGHGEARFQATSAGEPVYFDRVNQWAWRQKCHNRVRPAEAPQQEVAQGGGINQVVVVNNGPNPVVEMVKGIICAFIPRVNVGINLAGGGYEVQRCRQTQYPCNNGFMNMNRRPMFQRVPGGY